MSREKENKRISHSGVNDHACYNIVDCVFLLSVNPRLLLTRFSVGAPLNFSIFFNLLITFFFNLPNSSTTFTLHFSLSSKNLSFLALFLFTHFPHFHHFTSNDELMTINKTRPIKNLKPALLAKKQRFFSFFLALLPILP